MKFVTFRSRRKYLRSQYETSASRGPRVFFSAAEIANIAEWMRSHGLYLPLWGVCHGARAGRECDEFACHFSKTRVFGTDLFPDLGKAKNYTPFSRVVKWDFSKPNKKWIGRFDFIYSNSLDHSTNPTETLKIWMDQLTKEGALFIQWSTGHEEVGTGDCFGASLTEYIDLMNSIGRVEDLIYTNVCRKRHILQIRGVETLVLAVRKRR